ncbi:TPA: methyltransferase domain-containing protein [Legionella pneumophila]|nr:methyltransferase domain-containing protein [Legionella pneumophila]
MFLVLKHKRLAMVKLASHKKKLLSMLGDIKGCNVLDYGCGRGDFVALLLNSKNKAQLIYAVDSSSEMIDTINSNFSKEISSGVVITKIVSRPQSLEGQKFDKIICHNVLECLEDKIKFINQFDALLDNNGIFLLSHHDFDSAIFNSSYKEITRKLVHYFSDTQQAWQEHCDGQMGRKIPGLINHSVFKNFATCQTIRIVETEFQPGNYGYLMADMLLSIAESHYDANTIKKWYHDLEVLDKANEYYFAIDLVVATIKRSKL